MRDSDLTNLSEMIGHWTFKLGCLGLVVGAAVGLATGMDQAVLDWFALSVAVVVCGAVTGLMADFRARRSGASVVGSPGIAAYAPRPGPRPAVSAFRRPPARSGTRPRSPQG